MSLFQGYRLEKDENGYTVILFLSSHMTEFAEELAYGDSSRSKSLHYSVDSYINKNIPNIKVNTVRLMVGALLVSTIPFDGITVSAETSALRVSRYVNYRVTAGDSLWSISRKFNISINDIKAANSLNTISLDIDQILKVPIVNADATITLPSFKPNGFTMYRVASGDSLWLIARNFDTTIDRLVSLNRLTSDTIYVGQQLKIPAPEPALW